MTTSQKKRPDWLLPLCGLLVFLGVAVGLALLKERFQGSERVAKTSGGPSGVRGQSGAGMKVAMAVPNVKAQAAVWIEVHNPAKVREVLFANEWAQQVLKEPLGRGFVGPWAAFLGSRGEDLHASFSGPVLTLFAEEMLGSPFRVVWFENNTGGPAVVVPAPGQGPRAAFAAMNQAATHGTYTASTCPGDAPAPGGSLEVTRWLLAGHNVYGALSSERLVFAQDPSSALQGLCAEMPAPTPTSADLELDFAPERIGREEGELFNALGLGKVARLQFRAEKGTLVPQGLAAEVLAPGRLDAAPLSEDLLKAIPEDTSVLLSLQLKLPEELSIPSLQAYWKDGRASSLLTRQAVLLWNPRGDARQKRSLSILWSRKEDEKAMAQHFTGAHKVACEVLVLGLHEDDLKRVESACTGRVPNALNAAPPILAGLKAKASVAFGVHLGKLLPQLLLDGRGSDPEVSARGGPLPPEMEQAKRQLELLPFLGFMGIAQEKTWVPGGFRS